MDTIEERAKAYADKVWTHPMFAQEHDECERDYINAATEQKAIDIDKAVNWLIDNADDYLLFRGVGEAITSPSLTWEFRKAMEG